MRLASHALGLDWGREWFGNVMRSVAGRRAEFMVLLRQKIVGHGRTRVCNETCYNARCRECHCICGGKNHGVGVSTARQMVREFFVPLIETMGAKTLEAVRYQEKLPFGDEAA